MTIEAQGFAVSGGTAKEQVTCLDYPARRICSSAPHFGKK
jgi:hypothetical protein